MKGYITLPIILTLLMLSGCSRHANIIVDPKGLDMAQYQADLAECRQLSEQVESKAGTGAVAGAAVGAVVGEIVGGGNRTRIGASLGAVKGGLRGGAASRHERIRVIKNCLRHRGYHVLN